MFQLGLQCQVLLRQGSVVGQRRLLTLLDVLHLKRKNKTGPWDDVIASITVDSWEMDRERETGRQTDRQTGLLFNKAGSVGEEDFG